jgi:hypothetical protein
MHFISSLACLSSQLCQCVAGLYCNLQDVSLVSAGPRTSDAVPTTMSGIPQVCTVEEVAQVFATEDSAVQGLQKGDQHYHISAATFANVSVGGSHDTASTYVFNQEVHTLHILPGPPLSTHAAMFHVYSIMQLSDVILIQAASNNRRDPESMSSRCPFMQISQLQVRECMRVTIPTHRDVPV